MKELRDGKGDGIHEIFPSRYGRDMKFRVHVPVKKVPPKVPVWSVALEKTETRHFLEVRGFGGKEVNILPLLLRKKYPDGTPIFSVYIYLVNPTTDGLCKVLDKVRIVITFL